MPEEIAGKIWRRPKLGESVPSITSLSPADSAFQPVETPVGKEEEVFKTVGPSRLQSATDTGISEQHMPGDACAKHFSCMLPDPQHLIKLEAIMENEGISLEQTMLAHLIAALSTSMSITPFAEEAGDLVQRRVGIPVERVCPGCGYKFQPKRGNQQYCCNPCGARVNGGQPLMEHAKGKCTAILHSV